MTHFFTARQPLAGRDESLKLKMSKSATNKAHKAIPLHTNLLLKLARVSDAGSKIHHSLHA
nr:hypothetical protein [Burkholderia cepacia]